MTESSGPIRSAELAQQAAVAVAWAEKIDRDLTGPPGTPTQDGAR